MHICLVSNTKIPVIKYGGTERIVQWLAKEFIRMGHSVTLVAPPGSALVGVSCVPATKADEALMAIPASADIVHFHGWPPPNDFGKKWLFTLHGNSTRPELLPENTVCISENHAKRHGQSLFVYNGIDPSEFEYKQQKKEYLLFFSKVRRRVKGARRALKLARDYEQPLVLAGGTRIDLLKTGGFLDSLRRHVRFVGEIGGVGKARLFSDAKALLFPIDWDEPFGLVMIEALMSGTPVIATPRGSVPELIVPDVGALFRVDEEFPQALDHAMHCLPHVCQDWAMTNFSSTVCAKNYLYLYQKILDGVDVFAKGVPILLSTVL